MQKNKLFLLLTILLFGAILGLIFFSDSRLKKKGILLNAETLGWASGAKMTTTLKYRFYYKNKEIISSNPFNSITGDENFVGKYFPVMYDPKFEKSQLLISPSDFKRFHLPFPDSLKWVMQYFN